MKSFVWTHIIILAEVRERENENVRGYFCPRSGKEMGHFGKTGTEAMRRKPHSRRRKFSHMWLIPKDAEKPADGRLRNKKSNKLQEGNIS